MNEIGAERHVAAEAVLLVIGVGPGDVVPKIARVSARGNAQKVKTYRAAIGVLSS